MRAGDRLLADAIAQVARPAIPDARIESESVSVTAVREDLGPRWASGMPVSCVGMTST